MRLITISVLAVSLWTSAAFADRYRDNRRDDRRPVVRDNRGDYRRDSRPVVRDNRTYQRDRGVVVRDNRSYSRPRYTGPIRANRRVIERRPLYVSSGRFTFHNGRTVVYNRPIIREHYYDFRIRPQIVVENYPAQYGYIWVSGNWSWNGYEWVWASGHYEPDASINVYYDDDSWD